MKRILVVLLSLGLLMGLGASAFAASADFTGQYYATGWYVNNPSMGDKEKSASNEYYYQRARIVTEVKVAEGLSFTTRFDALESKWKNDNCWSGNCMDSINTAQNLSFERTYVTFKTKGGNFQIGYQAKPNTWGPKFQDSSSTTPGILWDYPMGAFTVGARIYKDAESSTQYPDSPAQLGLADGDKTNYVLNVKYKTKTLDAGLQTIYIRDATKKPYKQADGTVLGATSAYVQTVWDLNPYVTFKAGPVDVELEGFWVNGDAADYDDPAKADIKASALGYHAKAAYKTSNFEVGALVEFQSGDDKSTADKVEGGYSNYFGGGSSYKPTFMLFNSDYSDANGKSYYPVDNPVYGGTNTSGRISDKVENVLLYAIYGYFNPTKVTSVFARYTVMKADQAPTATGWVSLDYGKVLDVQGIYKIFDNLSYIVTASYLWTGDYWKGKDPNAKVDNNYFINHSIQIDF